MWKVSRRTTSCFMDTVEKYGHRGSIESVRHESRLNRNERMLTSCSSLSDKFSVEDENVEGVEEDDACLMDTVEKYGHRGNIESVRHEIRLNHNERIVNVLFVQGMTKSPSA
jgi:hypothetical protein